MIETIREKQNKIKIESKREGKKFREALRELPGHTGDSLLHVPDFKFFQSTDLANCSQQQSTDTPVQDLVEPIKVS